MVTKLIIVRHGETEENAKRITQGHLNSQLSEKGKEQAQKLALRLKDEKIDCCYSSDLDRCMNTAKKIIELHSNSKIVSSSELREQAKGTSEGQPHNVVYAKFHQENVPYHLWDYEGGETFVQLSKRTIKFIEKIRAENFGKTILVVTHGGNIRALLAHINNDDLAETRQYQAKNTEVTIITYENGVAKIEIMNNGEHL